MTTLSPTDFHRYADAALDALAAILEPHYESGVLEELEREPDRLTIITDSGKTFVVSKHGTNREIWLASPVSGGWHFRWDGANHAWHLPDNRHLQPMLLGELNL